MLTIVFLLLIGLTYYILLCLESIDKEADITDTGQNKDGTKTTILVKIKKEDILSDENIKELKKIDDDKIIIKFKGSKYDITHFAKNHPGGKKILVNNNGKDIEKLMSKSHHSDYAYKLLEKYKI